MRIAKSASTNKKENQQMIECFFVRHFNNYKKQSSLLLGVNWFLLLRLAVWQLWCIAWLSGYLAFGGAICLKFSFQGEKYNFEKCSYYPPLLFELIHHNH